MPVLTKRPTPQKLLIDIDGQRRECRLCHVVQPFSAFHKSTKAPGGVKSQCRPCDLEYQRLRYHVDQYGISPEKFREMIEEQDYRCAVCAQLFPEFVPRVDHDHRCCPGRKSCGKCVRGLLCSTCNSGLGMLGDDPEVLRRAADYLDQFGQRMQ